MKYQIIPLLLILTIATSNELSFIDLQDKLVNMMASPFVNLMFIYDSSTQMGPTLSQAIDMIEEKRKAHFEVVKVDCNSQDQDLAKNFPYCGPDIRPKLPALMFSEPLLNKAEEGEAQSDPKTIQYQGKLDEKTLYEFAVPLMKLYSVNLKTEKDWRDFKAKYPNTPKVLYFTDKDKMGPFYKTLTAHFRNTIAFAHIYKNSTLCQKMQVTKFPKLLLDGQKPIPLTSNLLEMISTLNEHKGEATKIVIEEFQQNTAWLTADNVEENVYNKSRHVLIHVPGKEGQEHQQWKKSKSSFKKMFDYYETDELLAELGVKHRPALVYFPKSIAKKKVQKTVFMPADTFRTIYDEISGMVDDFTVALSNEIEMQKMTGLSFQEERFVAVLFHQDQISLSYRFLSNQEEFKEGINFFRMKNPEEAIIKQFQIEKLPSLLVMTVDNSEEGQENAQKKNQEQDLEEGKKAYNLRIAHFRGKFNYDDLSGFFRMFLKPVPQEQQTKKRQIVEITSKKKFQKVCLEEGCYLLLLNGDSQKKEANQEYIETIKGSTSHIYQNVGYLDAVCHDELLQKLQIYPDEMPALIYLNTKFEKFSRLVGRIQSKAVHTFIAKVKSNKGIWKAYDNLAIVNKDCKEHHQKIKEIEQSYKMSAQEAQILEEIRLEEQKKNKDEEAMKKQKKKRRRRRPKEEDSEL